MTITITSNSAAGAGFSGRKRVRDNYMKGVAQASDGTVQGVWGFDLSLPYSFPLQANPSIGTGIEDLAGGPAGDVVAADGQIISFDGAGFDFTAVHYGPSGVRAPAAPLAGIWGTDQYYIILQWMLLPSAAAWPATSGEVNAFTGYFTQPGGTGETAGPGSFFFANTGTEKQVWFNRDTSDGIGSTCQLPQASVPFGKVALVAGFRTSEHVGIAIQSSTGLATSYQSTGSVAPNDFSAKKIVFGLTRDLDLTLTYPHKMYRGFIENLVETQRNPLDVIADEWKRISARGVLDLS